MTESVFKSELLKQEGIHPAETEVAHLKKMMEEEDRRATRLMRWAVGAWLVFVLLLVAGIGLPILWARMSYQTSTATQPTTDTVAPRAQPSSQHSPGVFMTILGPILVLGFFSLPIVAITLTIKRCWPAARRW